MAQPFEFDEIRKVAAEVAGFLPPGLLLPIVQRKLRRSLAQYQTPDFLHTGATPTHTHSLAHSLIYIPVAIIRGSSGEDGV